MANDYTPYQQKMIRAFYRNRDARDVQRLQEIVSEIFLAQGGKKAERLWARAGDILARAQDLDADLASRIVETRDLEALAELAGTRFG